jgi:gluconolactonase
VRIGVVVTSAAVLAASLAILDLACTQETGPGPPPRTNGCIDLGCPPVNGTTTSSSGGTSGSPAPDGGATFGDPLEGTTKQATLVRGRFRFTEGPVWIGGRLLFSDVSRNRIHELLPDGGVAEFRNPSGNANGLAVDAQGNLVACEGGAKRVSRSPATRGATPSPLAERYAEQPLNAPNDVIVRADGNIYFTDPSYSGTATQDNECVYRIEPGGGLSRVEHEFQKPNGVALSPDGATLYVVDNGAGKLLSAPVDPGGAVGAFQEIANVPGGDGMAVDDAGNLYVADENGVDVFTALAARKIGTITVEVKPTNCTFGGADRRTLYITANGPELPDGGINARSGLYMIALNVPGLP